MCHAYAAHEAGGKLTPFEYDPGELGKAALHQIEPVTEFYSFEQVNEAMEHLAQGKARYRIILKGTGN